MEVDDTNRADIWNRINEILGNPSDRMYVIDNHTVKRSMVASDLIHEEETIEAYGRTLKFMSAGGYDSGRNSYYCAHIPENYIKSVDKLEEGFIDMRVYKSSYFKQSDRITIKIYNCTPIGE